MPDWATSFLTEGFAQGPMVIWNLCMYMAVSLMGYDFPFAPDTGLQDLPIFGPLIQFVQEHSVYVQDIYNWFTGVPAQYAEAVASQCGEPYIKTVTSGEGSK